MPPLTEIPANPKQPTRKTSEQSPSPAAVCDVLSVMSRFPSWVEYRGYRMRSWCEKRGIRLDWMHDKSFDAIVARIEQQQPRVVINEVWQVPPKTIRKLAGAFPNVNFVPLVHCSPAYLIDGGGFHFSHWEFLKLSAEFKNVFYGHVMDEDRFVGPEGAKVISLPNILEIPFDQVPDIPPVPGELLRISLVGRHVMVKNWPSQVQAVALLAREIPVSLTMVTPAKFGELKPYFEMLRAAGVPVTLRAWGKWKEYLDIIRDVHIGLQASLTESFNAVAGEHMLLGKPVIGSKAIEFLPESLQANPQDSQEIAEKIIAAVRQYKHWSPRCRSIAEIIAGQNSARLTENLNRLLNA